MTQLMIGRLGWQVLGGIRRSAASTEVMMAIGILTIVAVLVVPLPAILLDLLLAFSVSLSVLILVTALFIERPLDFNHFRPCCSSAPCCGCPSTLPAPA